jgi:2-keto-4-pentenoate hydratase/2-oxohepta-3-ene-1,7-dioic acid hydratase in catechol pathway
MFTSTLRLCAMREECMALRIGTTGEGTFALGRFCEAGGRPWGLVVDDLAAPVERWLPERTTLPGLLDAWDDSVGILTAAAASLRAEESGTSATWADLEVLAPVEPRQVFQSGANYRSHVIDLTVARARAEDPTQDLVAVRDVTAAMMDARAANDQPYVFIGLPSSICGPFDDVVLPTGGHQHDWELELAAVIGRRAYRVGRAEALSYVAGYTIANDLTARDLVFRPDIPGIGTDWLAGKNAPTFLPTGPWLVPAAFVADPSALQITLRLNGKAMQDESTADMIFDVARLIEHVSSITPMLPGDLLLTGSPAGNGAHYGRFLGDGDRLEGAITGLGEQRNRCTAETSR